MALASKGTMGSEPVVVILPFRQQVFQINRVQIYSWIKLFLVGLLGTFNFSVQMRTAEFVRTKLYTVFHKPPLYLFRKEFHTPVGLDALYGKQHLIYHFIQKIKCIVGSTFFIYLEHSVACTVVYCRILIQIWPDFACIHLYPFSGNWAGVPKIFRLFPCSKKRLAVIP